MRPPVSIESNSTWKPLVRGFSLVELLTVMAVVSVLAGAAIPIFSSMSKSGEIPAASRLVCNTLTIARSQAIARQELIRFCVVTSWPDSPESEYRAIGIWSRDEKVPGGWKQLGNWEKLPGAAVVDPNRPEYVTEPDPNGYLLGAGANTFTVEGNDGDIQLAYMEFLPTGASRLPGATVQDVWLSLSTGQVTDGGLRPNVPSENGQPANWSSISANTLTGRLNVVRP